MDKVIVKVVQFSAISEPRVYCAGCYDTKSDRIHIAEVIASDMGRLKEAFDPHQLICPTCKFNWNE